MSTTVNYKGSTITTVTNETKTLTTAGKWLEGNIVITDTSSGGTAAISVVDTTDSHGGTVRTITGLDISDTTAIASDVAQGKYFYTADGTKTAGAASGGGSSSTLQAKTNINPTTSNQTITADSGYDGLSSVQINAMPTGTAGTPTATKSSVSNHSITVTPSVTNTTGYITGSTINGTGVSVTASELASGNKEITSNGNNIDVIGYSTVSVNVGGGSSNYTRTTIAAEQTVTPTSNGTYLAATLNTSAFESGADYIITYNGTEYFYTCTVMWNTNYVLGDINYFYGNTGYPYPFGIIWMSGTTCTLACGDSTAVTVKIEKLELIGDGLSSQTITGTVAGSGTTTLEIPCSFEPDLVYIYADLSDDVSLRGVVSLTILKDIALYMTSDGSQSVVQENLYTAIHGISSYNENNQNDEPYASYSNGVLSINTVANTSMARFASGIFYSYKLVGASSITQHTIYFEFADSTDATITAYWDSTFISNAITATTPTTYGGKTVTLAELDGVAWYEPANIPLNTQLIDFTKITNDTSIDQDTGEEISAQWYCISDYTFVDPSMTFTFACQYWGGVFFYDIDKNYLGYAQLYGQSWVTQRSNESNFCDGILTGNVFPSNTAYIRLPSVNDANDTVLSLIRTA